MVYVDTGPLPDGTFQNDFGAPEEQVAKADLVKSGDGWRLPPPPWAALAADVATAVVSPSASGEARRADQLVLQPHTERRRLARDQRLCHR